MTRMLCFLLLLGVAPLDAVKIKSRAEQSATANPIRKVVTMLQKMQAAVTQEGEEQESLYKKFMCYCKSSGSSLDASIEAATNKIASLESSLKGDGANKEQAQASLKDHQNSRADAKNAIKEAQSIRDRDAAAFAKESADLDANLAALTKAISAIESGVAGGFIQTSAADRVRKFAMEKADLPDMDRQEVLAFLSGSQSEGYVPQSGEIIGILKTIKDEMSKSKEEAAAAEKTAVEQHEALVAAKTKELEALTKQIEAEMTSIGELGVSVATMEIELEDAKQSVADDEKFKAELAKGCETKTAEWEQIKKTRAEELVALAETIKVLNDDDSLELFKKTLPGAASFVQVEVRAGQMRSQALSMIRKAAARREAGTLSSRPQLDLIALALSGKQQGFEKVVAMIDGMVAVLKKEQTGDDEKKEYCAAQFDESEDKAKVLENSVSDSEKAMENAQNALSTLADEMAALEADIKDLDKAVAEATELRKKENSDYSALMSADSTAKEVLLWAKNRLNKYYNPKLYKAPPAQELTEKERVNVAMGGTLAPTPAPGGIAGTGIGASFVQVASRTSDVAAPPPPPETFGAYSKKGGESTGVIAMIDLLVKDLDKEMQESEVTEKDSQKDYEAMMADSAQKRADDAKSLSDKAAAKAAQEEALQAETEKKAGTEKELMATHEYISSLHGECDWLLKHFDIRKTARNEEIDSLGRAKAVLSGADYA